MRRALEYLGYALMYALLWAFALWWGWMMGGDW